MARQPRFVIPELLQHVTQRGRNRAAIFRDLDDRRAYQANVVRYANRFRIRIVAHVEMDNHVHFALFTPTKEALSNFIQRVHSEHAQRMNAKYGTTGQLFGGRFYAASVDDEGALEVVRYIELNPVRAGMVERAVDYEFSSARAHVLGVRDPLCGDPWPPLREIEDYGAWLDERNPRIEQRAAAIRLLTRRGARIDATSLAGTGAGTVPGVRPGT